MFSASAKPPNQMPSLLAQKPGQMPAQVPAPAPTTAPAGGLFGNIQPQNKIVGSNNIAATLAKTQPQA